MPLATPGWPQTSSGLLSVESPCFVPRSLRSFFWPQFILLDAFVLNPILGTGQEGKNLLCMMLLERSCPRKDRVAVHVPYNMQCMGHFFGGLIVKDIYTVASWSVPCYAPAVITWVIECVPAHS